MDVHEEPRRLIGGKDKHVIPDDAISASSVTRDGTGNYDAYSATQVRMGSQYGWLSTKRTGVDSEWIQFQLGGNKRIVKLQTCCQSDGSIAKIRISYSLDCKKWFDYPADIPLESSRTTTHCEVT